MVVMPQYATSLKEAAETRASGASWPCLAKGSKLLSAPEGGAVIRGVCEREWAFVFAQALRAVAFLREHGVAHRDIKSDNWFIDSAGRVVLGDFGGAITLLRPKSRRDIPFTSSDQAACLNGMAWDPHVARLSRTGPPDESDADEDMTLRDVYDKSDMYAVGRMAHDLLDPSSWKRFPTSSETAPHCADASIPELPGGVSSGLRGLLRSLVLDDPAHRPSGVEAWRRAGVLAFGPTWSAPNYPSMYQHAAAICSNVYRRWHWAAGPVSLPSLLCIQRPSVCRSVARSSAARGIFFPSNHVTITATSPHSVQTDVF